MYNMSMLGHRVSNERGRGGGGGGRITFFYSVKSYQECYFDKMLIQMMIQNDLHCSTIIFLPALALVELKG